MRTRKCFVGRGSDPSINCSKLGRVPSLANLDALASRRRASLFLWYHTCLRHKSWYHRSKLSGSCNFHCFGIRTIPETSASAALRGFSRRQRPDGGAEGSAAGPSRAGRIRAQQRGYRVQRSGAAFVPRLFEAGPLVCAGDYANLCRPDATNEVWCHF